jgi:HSP20 family protein
MRRRIMTYMVSRKPFRNFSPSYLDFDELFDGIFGGSSNARLTARAPRVDVREEEDRYVLQADMPGLSEEEIEVKVENNVLSFASVSAGQNEGEEAGKQKENSGQFLLRERAVPAYSRSFTLPKDADAQGIEATYAGGVLTLSIKKAEEAQPRNIQINPA